MKKRLDNITETGYNTKKYGTVNTPIIGSGSERTNRIKRLHIAVGLAAPYNLIA